jgi:YrbI family 3-deoxy-D-manno-octulosonate 8-phosphate phosphatase
MTRRAANSKLKIFITDMDGVLTDGGKYLSEKGEEMKKFHIPDGMGLMMLKRLGIQTAIITSEKVGIVTLRAEQLKIDHVMTGVNAKLKAAEAISLKTGISLAEMAFIGDDINDYDLLTAVGFAACPADAQDIIKAIHRIRVMRSAGGAGAVREFINLLAGAENLLEAWRQG